ncbi:non-canonical polyA RNA polymerase PAPD5 [Crotalus adamanteus]|uniref:Acyltransferase n=1 Tax=Crotalus adamanteus TaxID=8729 RepID=A0AAW1CEH5_CROAD
MPLGARLGWSREGAEQECRLSSSSSSPPRPLRARDRFSIGEGSTLGNSGSAPAWSCLPARRFCCFLALQSLRGSLLALLQLQAGLFGVLRPATPSPLLSWAPAAQLVSSPEARLCPAPSTAQHRHHGDLPGVGYSLRRPFSFRRSADQQGGEAQSLLVRESRGSFLSTGSGSHDPPQPDVTSQAAGAGIAQKIPAFLPLPPPTSAGAGVRPRLPVAVAAAAPAFSSASSTFSSAASDASLCLEAAAAASSPLPGMSCVPLTWAPCVTLPVALAATAAAAVTASNKRKRDNKASTFSFNCTLLLGPTALGNGPLGRLSSRPEEPAYTGTPWKKTNYSPAVAGLTLHNFWISGEAIDELHERYLEKFTQLFEEHKAKYGLPQDKYLKIA